MIEVLLCQKFLPEHGGTIRWMYEVYRRWPRPVEVVTHDYYSHPPRTKSFPHAPPRPASGDDVQSPNLLMDRRDIFLHDWGLDRPAKVARYARMAGAVRQRLRRRPHQVVRVHCIHAVPEAACLWPLKKVYGDRLQIISYAHGEEITACQTSRQLNFLLQRALSSVDLLIANSRYTADLAKAYLDPAKITLIHPGVDLAEFASAEQLGQAWRQAQGHRDRLIVMTLGRMDPRKNHRAVLEAVGQLKARYPHVLYILAGEGQEKASLQQRAVELGLQDHTLFPGAVDGQTKLAFYGGCDVFAMPAIRDGTDVEGFGMVFLEAGACGKPVLAGVEGGQPDAVRDGQTGLVVDGTAQPAVTAALDRLLGDAALRQRLGAQNRAWAQDFDWPAVLERTLAALGDAPPASG